MTKSSSNSADNTLADIQVSFQDNNVLKSFGIELETPVGWECVKCSVFEETATFKAPFSFTGNNDMICAIVINREIAPEETLTEHIESFGKGLKDFKGNIASGATTFGSYEGYHWRMESDPDGIRGIQDKYCTILNKIKYTIDGYCNIELIGKLERVIQYMLTTFNITPERGVNMARMHYVSHVTNLIKNRDGTQKENSVLYSVAAPANDPLILGAGEEWVPIDGFNTISIRHKFIKPILAYGLSVNGILTTFEQFLETTLASKREKNINVHVNDLDNNEWLEKFPNITILKETYDITLKQIQYETDSLSITTIFVVIQNVVFSFHQYTPILDRAIYQPLFNSIIASLQLFDVEKITLTNQTSSIPSSCKDYAIIVNMMSGYSFKIPKDFSYYGYSSSTHKLIFTSRFKILVLAKIQELEKVVSESEYSEEIKNTYCKKIVGAKDLRSMPSRLDKYRATTFRVEGNEQLPYSDEFTKTIHFIKSSVVDKKFGVVLEIYGDEQYYNDIENRSLFILDSFKLISRPDFSK